MFSKEEAAQLRKSFWVSYGKSFPRKWVLYNTGIKNFSFKFNADRKTASVALIIESSNIAQRELLFEQLLTLKNILNSEYIADAVFDGAYFLENGKEVSGVFVDYPEKFSIYNKQTWGECYAFFNKTMHQFELFWSEYQDYIKQAVV